MGAINRIKDARYHTLTSALELAVGTTIEGIEGLRVVQVDDRKSGTGGKNNKPYAFQNLHVSDRGTNTVVQVWNFPDLKSFEGGLINLESTYGKNSEVYGVMIDEYKNEVRIKLSESGLIDNTEDARTSPENQWQNVDAHSGVAQSAPARGNAGRRPDTRQGARRNGPPPRGMGDQPDSRQLSNAAPANRHEKKPVFGATVGMAINQAIGVIKDSKMSVEEGYYFSRQFSSDLHTIASDILRVAEVLERGSFAPSAKQREKPAGEQPKQQSRQPQSREEELAASREDRDTSNGHDDSPSNTPLMDEGLEQDEIPWS